MFRIDKKTRLVCFIVAHTSPVAAVEVRGYRGWPCLASSYTGGIGLSSFFKFSPQEIAGFTRGVLVAESRWCARRRNGPILD